MLSIRQKIQTAGFHLQKDPEQAQSLQGCTHRRRSCEEKQGSDPLQKSGKEMGVPQVEVIGILALGKLCKPLHDISCTFLSANILIKLKKR